MASNIRVQLGFRQYRSIDSACSSCGVDASYIKNKASRMKVKAKYYLQFYLSGQASAKDRFLYGFKGLQDK